MYYDRHCICYGLAIHGCIVGLCVGLVMGSGGERRKTPGVLGGV